MTFTFLALLSALFGWIYTLSWSLSFYPQPLLNWKRRSTSGTTIDFHIVNVLGEQSARKLPHSGSPPELPWPMVLTFAARLSRLPCV